MDRIAKSISWLKWVLHFTNRIPFHSLLFAFSWTQKTKCVMCNRRISNVKKKLFGQNPTKTFFPSTFVFGFFFYIVMTKLNRIFSIFSWNIFNGNCELECLQRKKNRKRNFRSVVLYFSHTQKKTGYFKLVNCFCVYPCHKLKISLMGYFISFKVVWKNIVFKLQLRNPILL